MSSLFVGETISYWRKKRKKSQLELALEADISTRHLSFIESGKSRPSRDLILRLAKTLKLSYRQSNLLLNAAGFIAAYPEFILDDEQMKPIKWALAFMLKKHEPFPAVAITPCYDIVTSNLAFRHVIEWLAGAGILQKYPNIYRLIFAEDGLKPYFERWDILASALLERLHDEALFSQNELTLKLYKELSHAVNIDFTQQINIDPEIPVITFTIQKDGYKLDLFSTLTSFSTPSAVSSQEIRVESIFPATDESENFFEMINLSYAKDFRV